MLFQTERRAQIKSGKVENIVRKGENAGSFSHIPTMFSKGFFSPSC